MTVRYSSGLNMYLANTGSFKAVFANGAMYVFAGVQPGSADTGTAATQLGIISKDGNAWTPGSPTNGLNFDNATIVGGIVTQSKAAAETWQLNTTVTGTPGFARFVGNAVDDVTTTSTTAPRMDIPITVSGGVFNINASTVTSGIKYTVDIFEVLFATASP